MHFHASLLVATLATIPPLYSQHPAPPMQIGSDSAICHPSASPLETRAQIFDSLALLPADVSDFSVLTNAGDTLYRLVTGKHIPGLTVDSLSEELLILDNFAIATSAATPATYELLSGLLNHHLLSETARELRNAWLADVTNPDAATIIHKSMGCNDDDTSCLLASEPEQDWQAAAIPTTYVVATFTPGHKFRIRKLCRDILSQLQSRDEEWVTNIDMLNGFSGICIDVARWSECERRRNAFAAMLHQGGAWQKCHIMLRALDNALILAICENPQELRLADSPENSVLVKDTFSAFDANLNQNFLYASHTSKELTNVLKLGEVNPLKLAPLLSGIFTQLGRALPQEELACYNAAYALDTLGETLQQQAPSITQDTTSQIWWDKDLHLHASWDAMGARYQSTSQHLNAVAAAPTTIFYAESAPILSDAPQPATLELFEAGMEIAEGFAATLAPHKKKSMTETISLARAFYPELQALSSVGTTLCEGLDGHVALVLDSAHGTLPPCLTQGRRVKAWLPRLAFYAGIANRQKIAASWQNLLKTSGRVAGKLGADPDCIHMLPIVPTQDGEITSYKIALPFFSMDAVPSLSITDKSLAFGSSCPHSRC